MKLRTLEQFENAIDRESAWRRKELTTLRHQTESVRTHAEAMMIRAGIALLYAHWEGFVKNAGRLYVEFVIQKKLRYAQLSAPFLGIALRSKFVTMADAKSATTHVEFARFIQVELEERARLRPEIVDTQANLSSTVLRDVITRLGLAWTPYELKQHLIDQRLVEARNSIAHGQELQIERPDFLDLHRRIVELILTFREDVLAAAASGTYRRT